MNNKRQIARWISAAIILCLLVLLGLTKYYNQDEYRTSLDEINLKHICEKYNYSYHYDTWEQYCYEEERGIRTKYYRNNGCDINNQKDCYLEEKQNEK